MATFEFKEVAAIEGSSIQIGPDPRGSMAIASFVDGDNTVLLVVPRTALDQLSVCVIPTDELDSTDKVAEFDVSGSLTVT